MRIGMLVLAIAMGTSAGAWAETPDAAAGSNASTAAAAGAKWDDSHMQSRYQETPRTKRPRLVGESGYGALASGSSATSQRVSEGIEFTSQRQWIQGELPTSASANGAASGSSGGDHISRGSQLRAGSVSTGRGGR
ncbi:MAG TPA: hypothetical protein VII78_09810 [Myxococcota bacterium]|jgi:hypothetical protein